MFAKTTNGRLFQSEVAGNVIPKNPLILQADFFQVAVNS